MPFNILLILMLLLSQSHVTLHKYQIILCVLITLTVQIRAATTGSHCYLITITPEQWWVLQHI